MTSAWRNALHYVLLFAATGVSLPFAGLWFQAQGLNGAEIGTLLAAPMLARLVTGPMIALWADGFARRRTAIGVLGAVAALGYGAAGLVEGYALWLPLWFVGATAAAAIIPLADVLTLRTAAREGFTFAAPRSAGSIAFVAANVGMGALLLRASPDVIIAWITAASLIGAVIAMTVLPRERVHDCATPPRRERFRGLGALVADPVFMTAIFAVGAIQATHAFLYGFSAIEWKARGIPESMTGLLWGFSVVAEVLFMWVVEPWRRKRGIGPWPLLMIGGAAAVVRWTSLAFMPPLWLLWPLQALHAFSFAATFLAGLQIVERLAPPANQTAAQTLLSALSSGVLIGLATLMSGPLYDAYGALGYLAMAMIAVLGLAAGWQVRGARAGEAAAAGKGTAQS